MLTMSRRFHIRMNEGVEILLVAYNDFYQIVSIIAVFVFSDRL